MKNCVFCATEKRCSILTEKKCCKCRFAKTKEERDYGRQQAANRIKNLPEAQMKYIIDKYHYGKLC